MAAATVDVAVAVRPWTTCSDVGDRPIPSMVATWTDDRESLPSTVEVGPLPLSLLFDRRRLPLCGEGVEDDLGLLCALGKQRDGV